MTDEDRARIIELINLGIRDKEQHLELVSLHNKYISEPRMTSSTCGGCVQRGIARLRKYLETN